MNIPGGGKKRAEVITLRLFSFYAHKSFKFPRRLLLGSYVNSASKMPLLPGRCCCYVTLRIRTFSLQQRANCANNLPALAQGSLRVGRPREGANRLVFRDHGQK